MGLLDSSTTASSTTSSSSTRRGRCATRTPGTTGRRSVTRCRRTWCQWERVVDALVRSDAPAFDDLATWTGSVVRHPDGRWFMFYTGASLNDAGANVQSIGYAVSSDLYVWDKAPGPVLEADGRWYEKYAPPPEGNWHDEAFRDPWVVADPDGDGWHMLITARSAVGPAADPSDRVDRGVVGHAWSADLENWELREPLSSPGQGFGQLEVFQTHVVDGRQVLLFNCMAGDVSERVKATGTRAACGSPRPSRSSGRTTSPARGEIDDPTLYVGKFVDDRETGETKFLAFRNETGGQFIGEITDPYAVRWEGDRLVLSSVEAVAVAS